MNKSLEIFNRAVKESKGTNLIELANSEIQVIKESLERLEKLEKENEELKEDYKCALKEIEYWRNKYGMLTDQCDDYKKEINNENS